MKKFFVLILTIVFLLEFSPLAGARGGRGGGRGRGRGGGRGGIGGRSGGGSKSTAKIRDLANTARDRDARLSLGREI